VGKETVTFLRLCVRAPRTTMFERSEETGGIGAWRPKGAASGDAPKHSMVLCPTVAFKQERLPGRSPAVTPASARPGRQARGRDRLVPRPTARTGGSRSWPGRAKQSAQKSRAPSDRPPPRDGPPNPVLNVRCGRGDRLVPATVRTGGHAPGRDVQNRAHKRPVRPLTVTGYEVARPQRSPP